MEPMVFSAQVIEWRGPAPFVYAVLPEDVAVEVGRAKASASYGWGVIPVEATILSVTFTTSLFPKGGTYLLPLKSAVRARTGVTVGDIVAVTMCINGGMRQPRL